MRKQYWLDQFTPGTVERYRRAALDLVAVRSARSWLI